MHLLIKLLLFLPTWDSGLNKELRFGSPRAGAHRGVRWMALDLDSAEVFLRARKHLQDTSHPGLQSISTAGHANCSGAARFSPWTVEVVKADPFLVDTQNDINPAQILPTGFP